MSRDAARRDRGLLQELTVRAGCSLAIILFDLAHPVVADGSVRWLALGALLLNVPYYVAARTAAWPRRQAHVRIVADVVLMTLGLYEAGGLAAAHAVSVYMVIPVYAGIVFSSAGCLVATGVATVMYVGVGLAQDAGWLVMSRPPLPGAWSIAAFNLLMLNLVGGLTAYLAEVYRRSRRRVAGLHAELARANEALLRLNAEIQRSARLQSLGEVVAGVVHEIRNAQQVAAGYLQLARRTVQAQAPAAARYLEHVEEGCQTTLRIVESALAMARQPAFERVPVSLTEIAERVLDLKRYDLRRDAIEVRVQAEPAVPPVVSGPAQLQQVLLNLVTNAQEALRQQRSRRAIVLTIRMDVGGDGGLAVLEVADTGPGLAPEVLPRVFEPFYTTRRDGTGLGLSISAGIVRELGGELRAANRPDGGAVFTLSIPLAPRPA